MLDKAYILHLIASILDTSHVQMAHNELDKLCIAIYKIYTQESTRETQLISSNGLSLNHMELTEMEQLPY